MHINIQISSIGNFVYNLYFFLSDYIIEEVISKKRKIPAIFNLSFLLDEISRNSWAVFGFANISFCKKNILDIFDYF